VTATHEWDEPPQLFTMKPPVPNSLGNFLDENTNNDSLMIMHTIHSTSDGNYQKEVDSTLTELLSQPRRQRFIGVINQPTTEIPSHYSPCRAAYQYDAIAFIRESRGIRPLGKEDTSRILKHGDLDETFPFGE